MIGTAVIKREMIFIQSDTDVEADAWVPEENTKYSVKGMIAMRLLAKELIK